ncbi:MAG TPA: HEAT repeat domain-containing protein [Kofleriaceae bacterium]|nr:HEAT repeat domain-containing protein [Kofleriaceae bacterium]
MKRWFLLSCVVFTACANHAQHAVALYEAGDYAGAARAADQGIAAHPGDEGLRQMRVRAALAQGDGPGVARAYAAYRDQLAGEDDKGLLRELAIATLRQALASPSVKLKIAAIDAVAAAELLPLAEQVAERMSDDDDRVVAAAAVAVLHGFPQAPQAAGDMLHSEDAEARRIAVDGIGQKVGKLAIADLEAAGGDPDPRVRRTAIRWLGQLKDDGAVELLTRRLRDPDDAVRAAAATALARIGIGNLAELGKLALQDRALAVRLAGIELIVAARAPGELAGLDDDPDPIVAAEAAIARGPSAAAAAARAIDRAASSEEWTIRAGAANLAQRALGKPAALALARKLAADREPPVRLAAARVLAHAGDPAAAAQVFAAALHDPDHALAAAIDLAQQDDPRGVQALDAAVGDREHGPAARAAAATAHHSAHRITPGLVAALADDSGVVRVAAAAALAMLTRR